MKFEFLRRLIIAFKYAIRICTQLYLYTGLLRVRVDCVQLKFQTCVFMEFALNRPTLLNNVIEQFICPCCIACNEIVLVADVFVYLYSILEKKREHPVSAYGLTYSPSWVMSDKFILFSNIPTPHTGIYTFNFKNHPFCERTVIIWNLFLSANLLTVWFLISGIDFHQIWN